jgi:hypothetical protein
VVGVPLGSSHKASGAIFFSFGQFIIGIFLFVICPSLRTKGFSPLESLPNSFYVIMVLVLIGSHREPWIWILLAARLHSHFPVPRACGVSFLPTASMGEFQQLTLRTTY